MNNNHSRADATPRLAATAGSVPSLASHLPRACCDRYGDRADAVHPDGLRIVQDEERNPRLAANDHPAHLRVAELRRGLDELTLLPAVDPEQCPPRGLPLVRLPRDLLGRGV